MGLPYGVIFAGGRSNTSTEAAAEVVIIYTSQSCPHSFLAKRDLANRNVPYMAVDVDEDPEALNKMLALNGGLRRVPTIVEGDKVTVGFRGKYCAV